MIEKENENERFIYIKTCLAEGETREDISLKLGYRNWRSLDIFMRRQGMKWDSRRNRYYSTDDEYENPNNENSKVQSIISMFGNKDADPKKIAVQAGFRNHHEMAAYMKAGNYVWSYDTGNYILSSARSDSVIEEIDSNCNTAPHSSGQNNPVGEADISKYLPLLDLLLKNNDKLSAMFSETAPTIPRYAVSGSIRTKSFYMSDRISRLINDYSRSKNISQKEIVEAAIIEFLCKYYFKDEVRKILDTDRVL